MESNKARGRKNPIVYKTEGYDPRLRSANSGSNRSLGEVGAELENFGGDTMPGLVSSRCRLSDTLCFVCKTRLGPEVPKRIGINITLLKTCVITIFQFVPRKTVLEEQPTSLAST